MAIDEHNTFFAPPERASQNKIEAQRENFKDENLFATLLDSTPDYLMVLNENRQIVFANQALRNLFFSDGDGKAIYGRRLGEALNCQHAFDNPLGCGTSEFCRTCGAVKAVLSSLRGEIDVEECQIIRKGTNEALDLRIWSKPLILNNQKYSIFTFSDISNEKRRVALERIFFHDVLNTASALKSSLNLLKESSLNEKDQLEEVSAVLVDKLVEIIKAQRDLNSAELGELDINLESCDPNKLLYDTFNLYKSHELAVGKIIEIEPNAANTNLLTDSILLSRVLSNMIKNALEATVQGKTVVFGCKQIGNSIQFYVRNSEYMIPEVQYQVFNRSYSTKGKGRGLGTYSMKLLTERYLKGFVFFETEQEKGTTFYAQYPLDFSKK